MNVLPRMLVFLSKRESFLPLKISRIRYMVVYRQHIKAYSGVEEAIGIDQPKLDIHPV